MFSLTQDNQVDCLHRNRRGNRLCSLLASQLEGQQDSRHLNRQCSPRDNLRGDRHRSLHCGLLASLAPIPLRRHHVHQCSLRCNRLCSLPASQLEGQQDSRHLNRRDSPRDNLRGYHHRSRQVVLLATQLHDIDGPDPFFHSRRTTKPTAFIATVEATVYAAFWPAN